MELHTQDLTLRTVTENDLNEVARMWAFEKGDISMDEAQKAIQTMQSNHRKNQPGTIHHLCFAVFENGKSTIIGWCGLDGTTGEKLHLFYLIDSGYRNKGYATQCAKKLLAYAFDQAQVPYVNGGCDKNNIASYRVMEKIGMSQNGFEANGDPLFFIDRDSYRTT